MNKKLLYIIEEYEDYDKIITKLISNNVITANYLEQEVIKSKKADIIYKVASKVKGVSISNLTDAIIETGNVHYIYFFTHISGVPIDKLIDKIIESKDIKYITRLLTNKKNIDLEKIIDKIIKTENAEIIYHSALTLQNFLTIPTQLIEKLETAISTTDNAEYIYFFAYNINSSNKDKLANALVQTTDAKYIYQYITNIKNTEKDKLIDSLIETKNKKYILLLSVDTKITIEQKNKLDNFLNQIDLEDEMVSFDLLIKSIRERNNEIIVSKLDKFQKLFASEKDNKKIKVKNKDV